MTIMSLSNHKCSLGLDSSSFLPKKGALWSRLKRFLKKLSLVSFGHPDTFEHFRSYSTVVAEQQRQILEGGNYIIHPFSQISLYWNSTIAIVNLMHMIVSTFRLCYILEPVQPSMHWLDEVLLGLHGICFFDIFMKFNVGFKEEYFANVVFDRRRIAAQYLRCWFLIDLISCLPIAYVMLYLKFEKSRYILFAHVLPILRATRLRKALNDVVTITKVLSEYYIMRHTVHHLLLFLVTMHWSCCIVYSAPIFAYYWDGQMAKGYNAFFLNSTDGDLSKFPESYRYHKALFLSLSSFFGTSMSMYKFYNPDEYIMHSFITLYAAMFMIYSTVLILNIYITAYNSKVRYYGLINQVEAYMRHKQFPKPLRKRVRIFFSHKFSEHYYKEDNVFESLSEQLRYEVILHTYHKFVKKVKLLDGMPAEVIGILLSHLKPEVYLANDLVVRAGDFGDCLYFIGYGTVAVYSLKGAEICHMEDGEHFGGVALLMKDNKRIVTVVAIEISQLYRLDAAHFHKYLMSNPTLRDRMEAWTAQQMHETVLLDEAFRKQQKRKQEQLSFGLQSLSEISKESL
ncbi:potassium/sodium hyperpolarization-activated cyclic nucleotide-gated channel 3-like [Danaus plexippus]|uniref:potassium/sodium hyperpolarization-activated cyclic nucleotide-gated channel 3-like n=1 Tax=Danaus plexippus TaxID=13037 RepID=UPI002AB03538|nr:potassium/sodium hyperpolarization-activated cyclic nucleotide-gated channel 3-like [Danaus plexippus]